MARDLTESDVRRIVRDEVRMASRPPVAARIGVVNPTDFRTTLERIHQGERGTKVRLFHPYGFVSIEHPSMESLIVPILGLSANLGRVGVNDVEHRPTDLVVGESAWYSDEGDVIYLRRGREWRAVIGNLIRFEVGANVIEIDKATDKITVDAVGDVEVKAGGDVTITPTGAVNLGGLGGAAVARVGDTVAGGVITTGSSKVSAVA